MNKLVRTSAFYTILGLALGVFYREFTKMNDFTGTTQLSVTHTHALVLGMLTFLIVLLLEKNFQLSQFKQFNRFYIFYNIGLLVTLVMLTFHGIMTVLGNETGPAISGIAGLGHIIMTIGLFFLFQSLSKAVKLIDKK
ncbi:DUF2871 domain-containing protein [Vagococcus intermedius]|uniref:DUF2871 domain-containing protein n=1 Tax=Vagococcus intermedius TaxID=2991418 RepID=A0AAF0CTH7_9ENTE|nr:DUF2871 domain-containing protein [Vagococcus intermedius]WEG72665.1 DUF2871 domain-containing protein [Vagococcus intermedius]WEG74750.1 DUF2871 domain-containing protein [Vagococcus intermedius]